MITVVTTQTRPSISVPFFMDTVPVIAIAVEDVVRRTSTMAAPATFTMTEDLLTHTSTAVYANQQDLDTFLAEMDVAVPHFFTSRENYCTASGITLERVVTTS